MKTLMFAVAGIVGTFFLIVAGVGASDCPQCDAHQNWLNENAGSCNYQGARLPSICSNDPVCVQWNEACNRQRQQLNECIAQCSMPPPEPGSSDSTGGSEQEEQASECPQCDAHQNWLNMNAGSCSYQGARLPSICSNDPVCVQWNETCNRQRQQLNECIAQCSMPPPEPVPSDGTSGAEQQEPVASTIAATTQAAVISCGDQDETHVSPQAVPEAIDRNPELLEELLRQRNPDYDRTHVDGQGRAFTRYGGIAALYKKWCGRYGVRFDLAFAQMLHETNYLRFTGSVPPSSFNFAGINAPSSTSAGEQYPGIEHGVKAHCQHLAVYGLINVTGSDAPRAPQDVCSDLGDPLEQLENAACFESPYTERVRRTTIWPRVCETLGRPATFDDLGPTDNACISEVDANGRCCDVRAGSGGECLGDLVAWARGERGEGYGGKVSAIHDRMMDLAGVED